MTASPRPPARTAILEDDPAVRAHFIEIVSSATDLVFVAAADCLAAAGEILDASPDIILCDIGLPDGSGLDFIPQIRSRTSARALVITAFGDRDTVLAALEAGADGYLLKDSSPAAILDGIAATLDGGAPVSPAAAVYLLERLRKRPEPEPANAPQEDPLTPREAELLQLFARGMSYKVAARELGISPLTVGNHVKAIYRKLQVNSRSEAVGKAAAAIR